MWAKKNLGPAATETEEHFKAGQKICFKNYSASRFLVTLEILPVRLPDGRAA